MNLITRAMEFAEKAHAAVVNDDGSIGQLRKYTKEPYTVHTKAVAAMLAVYGMADEVVAAAHLHDVVEDCPVGHEAIQEHFGEAVAKLVAEVTDVPKSAGNRSERKAMDIARLANASAEGQTIKCADMIDNTFSIVNYDKKFARTYLAEKEATLNVLTKADPDLLALAWHTLRKAQEKLMHDSLNPLGAG